MQQEELDAIVAKHGKWLSNEPGGKRANLQRANLQRANLQDSDLQDSDLRGYDLQGADLQRANLRSANLQGADLQGADLQRADLQGADLQRADLRSADLQGASLDYSVFPLWCGGTRFKADDRLVAQVLAHLCSLDVSEAARAELDKVLAFARTSHRAKDCGILEEKTA